jgi:hypothetical protein
MSMHITFCAFSEADLQAMQRDHALVDRWVWEEERSAFATTIEDGWDALRQLLGGEGFRSGAFLDDVLSNGAELVPAEMVREQAAALGARTAAEIRGGLDSLPDATYHIEGFREEPERLVEEFERLAGFFRQAAERGLGALYYAA